jgi:hypothetical protein
LRPSPRANRRAQQTAYVNGLLALLRNRFHIDQPEELSITEASGLIDELKTVANGNGAK